MAGHLHILLLKIFQSAEDSFCKNSDKIVFLPSHACEYLMEHGMSREKFVHLPNGIGEEEWSKCTVLDMSVQMKLDEVKKKHIKLIWQENRLCMQLML